MSSATALLLGASGACGQALIDQLGRDGVKLIAVSRQPPEETQQHVLWLEQDLDQCPVSMEANVLISLGPLIHALQQVETSSSLGRVVAMSSASTVFKIDSSNKQERALMRQLKAQEQALKAACSKREIILTIIKPTLIYSGRNTTNVGRIQGLANRLGLLPYCGRGLRHPVHSSDLAKLICRCLVLGKDAEGSWLVGGGETLEYSTFLRRIMESAGQNPRLLRVPIWAMKLLLSIAHASGRLEDVNSMMLQRQNVDLVVDDTPARQLLDWSPRRFVPGSSEHSFSESP